MRTSGILTSLLTLSVLLACQPSPTASNAPATGAALPPAAPVTARGLTLQGNVLMPSGVQQTASGILMPSGVVIPSGILMPSGIGVLSTPTAPLRFDGVPFEIQALERQSGRLVASTRSDGRGRFRFADLPAGADVRLVARAVNLPAFELRAAADLPQQTERKALQRNISAQTTLAVLVAERASVRDSRVAEVPLGRLQGQQEDRLEAIFDRFVDELLAELGTEPLDELTDILDELDALLLELEEILAEIPDLLAEIEDLLLDPDYTEDAFDEEADEEALEEESETPEESGV